MRISNTLELTLRGAFFPHNTSVERTLPVKNSSISVVATDLGGTFFVPSISFLPIITALNTMQSDLLGSDIVAPLSAPVSLIKKTSDSIISSLFLVRRTHPSTSNFMKIDTCKGYNYFGGKGLILNESLSPLLICGIGVKIINDETRYEYSYPICLVSPEVFDREDLISKAIVKKVIPYISNMNTNSWYANELLRFPSEQVRVLITKDINKVIHKVEQPNTVNIDAALYEILDNSIQEIIT